MNYTQTPAVVAHRVYCSFTDDWQTAEQARGRAAAIVERDRAEAAARIAELEHALAKLIVAIELETPPIINGTGVERRAFVLQACAKEARETLGDVDCA